MVVSDPNTIPPRLPPLACALSVALAGQAAIDAAFK